MNELSPVDMLEDTRRKVFWIEEQMRRLPPEAHVEIATEHFFHGGVYARKVTIPKGALVTGEIHKYDNMNFMQSGELLVLLGMGWTRLKGPGIILAPAGIKRIAFAIEETVWITVLPTKERDPRMIEKLFIAKSEEEYQQFLALTQSEPTKWLS